MKSYGGGSFFSIMRQDVLETTEQLSRERRYPVLKIDRLSQNFTLFKIQVLEINNKQKIIFNQKMARKEIQQLFEEAMHFAKFSKSKTKVLFWSTVRKLEKFLASSPNELDHDQREKLNAAKKKFL